MANTFKNAQIAATTVEQNLYTCPAATSAIIHALYVANIDGTNSADITVRVRDSSAAVDRAVAYVVPVPAGSTLVFDKPINLEANDVLKVTASANGDLEVFASILEIA